MTFSSEKDAWDADNGLCYRAENVDGWRVVRYEGDPAEPDAKKHLVSKVYDDEQEANLAARNAARGLPS